MLTNKGIDYNLHSIYHNVKNHVYYYDVYVNRSNKILLMVKKI